MTVELYKWSTPEQIAQLQDYLVQNTPSSSSHLGFLINNSGSKHVDIWTSHIDPFDMSDIVVWVFDYQEGIRVFVNTEFVLDNAEFAAEAKAHMFSENRHTDNIPFFKSEKDESLYRRSLSLLEKVIIRFMTDRKLGKL
jgi:hypothetical protein